MHRKIIFRNVCIFCLYFVLKLMRSQVTEYCVWVWRRKSSVLQFGPTDGERLGLSILHWMAIWFWNPWFCIYPTKLTPRPVEKRKKATTHQTYNQNRRKYHPNCLFSLVFFQIYIKISGCFRRNGKCLWQTVVLHPADIYYLEAGLGSCKSLNIFKFRSFGSKIARCVLQPLKYIQLSQKPAFSNIWLWKSDSVLGPWVLCFPSLELCLHKFIWKLQIVLEWVWKNDTLTISSGAYLLQLILLQNFILFL